MNKYEFFNEEKSIIRHNLVPEMLIEVIKLPRVNDYTSVGLGFDDIFDEKIIKGWHFIFKVMNDEDFEDVEDFSHIRSILKRAGKWYQAKIVVGEIKLDKFKSAAPTFEDNEFKLIRSDLPGLWLLAHKETAIIIEFEEYNFNETQKISELTSVNLDLMSYAKLMRLAGEWLALNNPEII
ncbi:hypothetical protein [Chryseobacterium indologenes]|uniref:Uncharacterized protein n=1 Tax=Chryseobacterium indologenes TaxID=253 RepID=A0A0N1KSG8_CHRID|nr:hypothetical protein [Chryseobacterium indologenes]KPE51018.1 hypothetical protein AOB46_12590 [Chryseobacterium indologenes]